MEARPFSIADEGPRGGVLTESQLRLLRRHRGKLTDPEQHVEVPAPGFLLC